MKSNVRSSLPGILHAGSAARHSQISSFTFERIGSLADLKIVIQQSKEVLILHHSIDRELLRLYGISLSHLSKLLSLYSSLLLFLGRRIRYRDTSGLKMMMKDLTPGQYEITVALVINHSSIYRTRS